MAAPKGGYFVKASKFNLLLPENNGENYLLHNTMYGATLKFSKNLFAQVESLLNRPDSWVYASYYVINCKLNRVISIFRLTLCDKATMFCHIWKQKASHLQ